MVKKKIAANKRIRKIRTGSFVFSVNREHIPKIRPFFIFFSEEILICSFPSKISSGSHRLLIILISLFCLIGSLSSKSFSKMFWWISSTISGSMLFFFTYWSILLRYFSRKSLASLSIWKVCPWNSNVCMIMK